MKSIIFKGAVLLFLTAIFILELSTNLLSGFSPETTSDKLFRLHDQLADFSIYFAIGGIIMGFVAILFEANILKESTGDSKK